ncbi:MAG: N-acetylneuraminate lyase [Pedobacter sp.]|nr:MAG: N-acetylneuraminate lyase [Pedobacter sp.]
MRIKGLIAATFAGYHPDGTINLNIIPTLVEQLIEDGVNGVFVCGTNGEGPNLTVEERMAIAEAYVKAANKRILIFVHVGHTAITESRKLAAHAQQIGADAISSVAAFYFKPNTVENLMLCMQQIAAAAPALPFYYYHIPAMTGVNLDMVEFLEVVDGKIPNFAGIKYTAASLHEYQACLAYKDNKFDILYGYDELLLPALAVGAKGAIGSTYNFAAPIYTKVIAYFEKGNLELAQKEHLKAVQMVRCLVKYPPIPAQREIMKWKGYDLGPCRLPLVPLTNMQAEEFKRSLSVIGFL